MMTSALPLSSHPAFACSNAEALGGLLESTLGATIETLAPETPTLDVHANRFLLPNSDLWFCSYALPLSVRFPDSGFVRIQFHHRGAGATRIAQDIVPITRSQACVSDGAIAIDFGADFQQFVWRIPRETLVRKLSILTDGPVAGDPDFDRVIDLETSESALMVRMLDCLVHAAETVEGEPAKIVLGELEQTLITAFLTGASRDFRKYLQRPAPGLAPKQVHRAESYLEQNWDRPVSIEELVSVTGASARSIFRAFKQTRGYTPQEFARRIRLNRARSMLIQSMLPLTEIALACGFADSSHFSREYQRAFGQRPSERRKEAELLRA